MTTGHFHLDVPQTPGTQYANSWALQPALVPILPTPVFPILMKASARKLNTTFDPFLFLKKKNLILFNGWPNNVNFNILLFIPLLHLPDCHLVHHLITSPMFLFVCFFVGCLGRGLLFVYFLNEMEELKVEVFVQGVWQDWRVWVSPCAKTSRESVVAQTQAFFRNRQRGVQFWTLQS